MLKTLYEKEKIESYHFRNLLNEFNGFNDPNQIEKLLVAKNINVFWRILSEIRRFHFSLFFEYFE